MKYKNALRAISFVIVFCILFLCCEKLFFNKNDVNSVWGKLDNTDIDILIMGNSHAYTSLNAKALSDAIGLEVDLLGSSSQYMEQTLENLKVVLQYQTPKYIVLETNCSYGDRKESMRGEFMGMMLQNSDGIKNYWYKLQSVVRTYKLTDVFTGMFQLVRPVDMWTRWSRFPDKDNYIADANGFRGTTTTAVVERSMQDVQDEYMQIYEAGKRTPLTDYNERALREFLQLAQDNGIEVWMYKGPTTRAEYARHALEIEDVCRNYSNVTYIDDMHAVIAEIGLGQSDWYDTGHVNRAGAGKVTRYYGELIAERLGVDLDWNASYEYCGEKIKQTEAGTYQYTMENYSEECLYQFKLYVDGKLQEVQDYSTNNVYECAYDARTSESCTVYCSMIPTGDAELGDGSESRIYTAFMKQNDCVIE